MQHLLRHFPKTHHGKRRLLWEQGLWGDTLHLHLPQEQLVLGILGHVHEIPAQEKGCQCQERRRKGEQRPLEQPLLP